MENLTPELKWKNTCMIAERSWPYSSLLAFMKKNPEDSLSFMAMVGDRKGVLVSVTHNLGQLYDLHHDREDKMLYLRVAELNSFGYNHF